MLDRAQLDRILAMLQGTSLAEHLVLVGSAAMYLAGTNLPPMTADADFAVETARLAKHLPEFLEELRELGFERVEDTATFSHPAGLSFDLLGIVPPGQGDQVARAGGFAVLAFEELSRLLEKEGSILFRDGSRVLAPAPLVFSKLRTMRVYKGIKDKVQALAMMGERAQDEAFKHDLTRLALELNDGEWEDVLADAQVAFVGLETEEARAYAEYNTLVARGFGILQRLRGQA